MGRRKKNDVFVIGDEQLATETQTLPEPDHEAPPGDQEPGGAPPPGLGRPSSGTSPRARWLAALGIAVAAAGVIGTLELSSSGGPQHPQGNETSARPALVFRPAPGATPPNARENQPERPASTSHAHRPEVPKSEPEREPAQLTAPASSPTPTVALPVAEAPPASTPPSPSPLSSGGGPGGEENFGFER